MNPEDDGLGFILDSQDDDGLGFVPDSPAGPNQAPQTSPPQEGQGFDGIARLGKALSDKNPSKAAAVVNEATASVAGAIPDLATMPLNAAKWAASKVVPGPEPEYFGSLTEKISEHLNKGLSEQEKLGNIPKQITRFVGSLFGVGWAGKALETGGKALEGVKAFSEAGKAIEKTGSLVGKLGVTAPTFQNVAGPVFGGAVSGASQDANLPASFEIPATILAFMFGGAAGKRADNLLKPLYQKVPGLKEYIQKQNYQELGQKINPEYLGNLVKTSVLEGETEFLTQKTFSELPKELQTKIQNTPQLLNDTEINYVIEKGKNDYLNYNAELSKKWGWKQSLGEMTADPKIVATEDALANKPNIDTFDKNARANRISISREIEKIKHRLSSQSVDKTSLGETVSAEIDKVYKKARDARSKNWDNNFGGVVDENILHVPNFIAKIKEFSKLKPDTVGNKVSIKAARDKLRSGVGKKPKLSLKAEKGASEAEIQVAKMLDELLAQHPQDATSAAVNKAIKPLPISPRRGNEILVGLNEDFMRFADRTFSRKQIGELRKSLELDFEEAASGSNVTAEQARMVQKARADYKADSQLIDEIGESMLFSKVDKGSVTLTPEKISEAFEKMDPSQIKSTLKALKKSSNYDRTLLQVQKYYIDRAFKAATKDGIDRFSPAFFLKNLPEKEVLNIVFEGSSAFQEIKEISFLLKKAKKNEPVRGNSKSAQRLEAAQESAEDTVLKTGMAITKKPFSIFSILGEAISSKNASKAEQLLAELLINPEARAEVLQSAGKEIPKANWKKAIVPAAINYKDREGPTNIDPYKIPILGKKLSTLSKLAKD